MDETLTASGRDIERAWRGRQWTDADRQLYADHMRLVCDDPEAVREGVQSAIAQHGGDFPPSPGELCRYIAIAHKRRQDAAKDAALLARQAQRRREKPQPSEPWRGWLAMAATHAMLADRGITAKHSATLQPYVDLVLDLGYRNHHGCGDYRDADGHLHPADPAYDATLAATALHGAEQIWREQGMPAAPSPAQAFRASLGAAA